MAAIDEINIGAVSAVSYDSAAVRRMVGSMFWAWFHANQNQRITTIKVWFFSKTVYVRDLEQIFLLLFGPEQ